MRRSSFCLLVLVSLGSLCAAPVDAQSRTLKWPEINVTAHLEADGQLQVRERQTILLSGDWNGPERVFNVPFGQNLTLTALTRLDPATGEERALREGDLERVDEYRWFDAGTLRWRSRLPEDPPHDSTTLVYTLDLRYENILRPTAGSDRRYALDHEFAFANRWDDIDRFTLTLTLDPVWRAPADFTGRFEVGRLTPGETFTVTIPLEFTGAARPAAVVHGASDESRTLIAAAVFGLALLLVGRLLVIEYRLGRFAPLPSDDAITKPWLETHVLRYPPEVIGTAWDDTTAAPEVAATLARLVVDGKLESSVKEKKVWKFRRQVLHLRLRTSREKLSEHDRLLINALFEHNKDRTDTDAVRERYSSTGFDPAAIIKPAVRQMLDSGLGLGGTLPAPSRWPAFLLLLGGLGLVIAGVAFTSSVIDVGLMLPMIGASLGAYALVSTQAAVWQRRVVRPGVHLLLRVILPLLVGLVFLSRFIAEGAVQASAFALAGLATVVIALVHSVLNTARSRHDAERLAVRKRLAAARAHFARELQRPFPALDDKWLPWVLGFGLGRAADKWFRAFGGAAASGLSNTTSNQSLSSATGSGGSGWSGFGGGGGFAGAGSSASFAAAVGGMAASVAAPSSSGSSGGGGGGGSSGGGGGGGW